ncbi:deoxyribodipyrimidine photo-lyase [bacterium SCSIO 12643]|nr:deoxyribodipyrimidine photo-lyase [bacterium SCSIO 12643]
MNKKKVSIFWFRRDLRLHDNTGLIQALKEKHPVLLLFIFDQNILDELPKDDARVGFIHSQLDEIHKKLAPHSGILIHHGTPVEIWNKLLAEYDIQSVHANRDYEPYARKRDTQIKHLLHQHSIPFHKHKDQVIFEKSEIVKPNGMPYTVYTPYKNKWRQVFQSLHFPKQDAPFNNLIEIETEFPSLASIGFEKNTQKVNDFKLEHLDDYAATRDIPSIQGTSDLSPHLRFGTVSIREIVLKVRDNETFLNELIWREFFMQILFHFPQVMKENFKPKYNSIPWRNNQSEFEKWCNGQTGYPMVDAGMRQLNATGYMHNRVRMITAGFLCKHLLIHWSWGEAYFAQKLLDYDLSANNGNWQWSAGTGCDAAPYFRVFNPTEQLKKFDPDLKYIQKWIPEFGTDAYPTPMVDHAFARKRALETYKSGIQEG